MKSGLFNEKAMDSLTTPEQLDQRVKIIRPGTWILFLAVLIVAVAAVLWGWLGTISSGDDFEGVIFQHDEAELLYAQTDGIVQDVLANPGDVVAEGDILAVIDNDNIRNQIKEYRDEQKNYNMESTEYKRLQEKIDSCNSKLLVRSTANGVVQSTILKGDYVSAGKQVMVVIPENDYGYKEVFIYVSKEDAGALQIGMEAQITPSYVNREEYGYMHGVISDISANLVTDNDIISHMGTVDYVKNILPDTNCVEVTIQLSIDTENDNVYSWSNAKGRELTLDSGDLCDVHIVKSSFHPYELLFQ